MPFQNIPQYPQSISQETLHFSHFGSHHSFSALICCQSLYSLSKTITCLCRDLVTRGKRGPREREAFGLQSRNPWRTVGTCVFLHFERCMHHQHLSHKYLLHAKTAVIIESLSRTSKLDSQNQSLKAVKTFHFATILLKLHRIPIPHPSRILHNSASPPTNQVLTTTVRRTEFRCTSQ